MSFSLQFNRHADCGGDIIKMDGGYQQCYRCGEKAKSLPIDNTPKVFYHYSPIPKLPLKISKKELRKLKPLFSEKETDSVVADRVGRKRDAGAQVRETTSTRLVSSKVRERKEGKATIITTRDDSKVISIVLRKLKAKANRVTIVKPRLGKPWFILVR